MTKEKFQEAILNRKKITDQETSLLKNTFDGRQDLLVMLRKFLLQGELTPSEIASIKSISTPAILAVLKKYVVPDLDKGADPFMMSDSFKNEGLEGIPLEHARHIIKYRHLVNKYLNQRFQVLAGKKVKDEIKFDDLISPNLSDEDAYVGLLARNFLITNIDKELFNGIWIKASATEETIREMLERQMKNSTK